jgi:hypothetical protein
VSTAETGASVIGEVASDAAAAAGVRGAPTTPPRDSRRWRMDAYRGSRSLRMARIGDATKIDE